MGYRVMRKQDLYEIYRRWQAGQTLSRMAATEGWDRKRIRGYLQALQRRGLSQEGEALERQKFYGLVKSLLPQKQERRSPATDKLDPQEKELRELIEDPKEPLKPKSAFTVVSRKYELAVSYETFKHFARLRALSRRSKRRMIRIELPAGLETQLDYGRVGLLWDSASGRNRTVWAFCGVLTHSRLPFVEFVFTQEQVNFVGSVVRMGEYYGGFTEFLSPDNLKAAVIKPDLWDPQINRALAEAAEHYGTFIDPCRIGRATDKGKVERFVPVTREQFRILKRLHPGADRGELNRLILDWCRTEYGQREHGSTGVAPMELFKEEREQLKALPDERYEVPLWAAVHVHAGDQFFSFSGMRFSIPGKYKGRELWTRYTEPMLQVYEKEQLVRQYVVREGKRMYWTSEDFPVETRHMINGGYPKRLIWQAHKYGAAASELIGSVLEPHAYLNARRARGMLDVLSKHCGSSYFEAVCLRACQRQVKLPKTLKRMMERERDRPTAERQLELSPLGSQMVRDIRYYLN